MLDGDPRAIKLAYSLAFSLPGTPVLFYGEEIGMAENLAIEGRYAVRRADAMVARRRVHVDRAAAADGRGRIRPERVNVADQRRDPDSLLNWFERLIRRRRECPELGFGAFTLLETGAESVLAHRCDWEGATIVAVHELGGKSVGHRAAGRRRRSARRPVRGRRARAAGHAELEPYAAHWFRVRREGVRLPP